MSGSRKQSETTAVAERLYRRNGKRDTTFFYKHVDNTNEIFATARTANKEAVARAQIAALQKWGELRGMEGTKAEDRTLAGWFKRYFTWQEALPATSSLKKAASTIVGNLQEQKPLLLFFGAMLPAPVSQTLIYEYVDLRTEAGAPASAVKEVALLSAVFKFIIRKGGADQNPCRGLQLEKTAPKTRKVTWDEVEFLTQVGRELGGSYHLQALAARAAWLAFKRPGEVLKVPRSGTSPEGRPLGVTEAGLAFLANKRRRRQGEKVITITWTPTLRATIDEALAIGRWQAFGGDRKIFGTQSGRAYSRSGWGTIWGRLMGHCAARAQALQRPFQPFALADCRPGGITEKKRKREDDVYDGTGHVDRRMVDSVYDRRDESSATAAK